jgi:hypothetical protein
VHSAKVPDQDGLGLLLKEARTEVPRLSHLWLDAGYEGRGKWWAQEVLGLSVEVVRRLLQQSLLHLGRGVLNPLLLGLRSFPRARLTACGAFFYEVR